ncbi:hypothetical protein NQZ68_016592 [Dissostichus eleginoides]|nr:hypothetical protein NQZ68_016592 [Dissostichus eleginoides]
MGQPSQESLKAAAMTSNARQYLHDREVSREGCVNGMTKRMTKHSHPRCCNTELLDSVLPLAWSLCARRRAE